MERILIIGCSGAGKSTLARKLGDITGIPVVHLDSLFWKPGWVESTREEIDEKIRLALAEDRWILDGNYSRTLPMRLERCDSVIFLDYPRWLCLWGVVKRVAKSYGKVRPDMPEGCHERIDWEIRQWVWNFHKNVRPKLITALENAPDVQLTVLKNRTEAAKFLERVASGHFL